MHDRADLEAPADVDETIDWLLAAGFAVSRLLTEGQANANKLIELARDGEHVVIVRDRGVWECGFRGDGWVAGLHTLHEAATGEIFEHRPGAPLPRQHPSDDLSWADAVPSLFAWRAATPDWRTRLDAATEAAAERIRRRRG